MKLYMTCVHSFWSIYVQKLDIFYICGLAKCCKENILKYDTFMFSPFTWFSNCHVTYCVINWLMFCYNFLQWLSSMTSYSNKFTVQSQTLKSLHTSSISVVFSCFELIAFGEYMLQCHSSVTYSEIPTCKLYKCCCVILVVHIVNNGCLNGNHSQWNDVQICMPFP